MAQVASSEILEGSLDIGSHPSLQVSIAAAWNCNFDGFALLWSITKSHILGFDNWNMHHVPESAAFPKLATFSPEFTFYLWFERMCRWHYSDKQKVLLFLHGICGGNYVSIVQLYVDHVDKSSLDNDGHLLPELKIDMITQDLLQKTSNVMEDSLLESCLCVHKITFKSNPVNSFLSQYTNSLLMNCVSSSTVWSGLHMVVDGLTFDLLGLDLVVKVARRPAPGCSGIPGDGAKTFHCP